MNYIKEKKLYILGIEHLNGLWKRKFLAGNINFYNLEYDYIIKAYRDSYEPFIEKGYSLLLIDTQKGLTLILKYNS